METDTLVLDAFAELGVEARELAGVRAVELVVDPEGPAARVDLRRRALVDESTATRLIADGPPLDATLLVVADRVTEGARRVLSASGAGYLDLRGHLALRTPGIIINTEVSPVKEPAERSDPLAGAAGLEVVTAVLMEPRRPAAVRELARSLGRAPSTVSSILNALRGDHLIDSDNTVTGTDLFWRVAERWSSRRTRLASLPDQNDAALAHALRFGLDEHASAPGWALTDSAAAAAYGAPIAVRSGQVMDFLVPDRAVLRRATTLLHSAQSTAETRATVRVAPVPRAVTQRVAPTTNPFGWPLAHPLFVALDLAQDSGRGREILENWTPDGEWPRVW